MRLWLLSMVDTEKGEITAEDALTELERACKKYVIDRLLVSAEAAKLGILE